MKNIAEKAAALLAGLGETSAEIAANLRGAGYKGVRFSALCCPCGSCLRDHLGVDIYVRNGPPTVGLSPRWSPDEPVLARHVMDFVARFDQGHYPDLTRERTTNEEG